MSGIAEKVGVMQGEDDKGRVVLEVGIIQAHRGVPSQADDYSWAQSGCIYSPREMKR